MRWKKSSFLVCIGWTGGGRDAVFLPLVYFIYILFVCHDFSYFYSCLCLSIFFLFRVFHSNCFSLCSACAIFICFDWRWNYSFYGNRCHSNFWHFFSRLPLHFLRRKVLPLQKLSVAKRCACLRTCYFVSLVEFICFSFLSCIRISMSSIKEDCIAHSLFIRAHQWEMSLHRFINLLLCARVWVWWLSPRYRFNRFSIAKFVAHMYIHPIANAND